MPRLASTLSPFKAIMAQFKCGIRQDKLDKYLDHPIDKSDAAEATTGKVAARRSERDTGNSDFVAGFGGEATAAGEYTAARGNMIGKSADFSPVSTAVGKSTFTETTTEPGSSTAFTPTSSFANASGADLGFVFNEHKVPARSAGAIDMPCLPSALSPFKSILAQFECAVRHDKLDTSLDYLVGKLDALATKTSMLAARRCKKDIDNSDIVAEFGGEATAVGEHTVARGNMIGRAADVGLVSYAVGKTTFTAAATEPGDSTAFASTSSFANVAGADLVFVFNDHKALASAAGASVAYSRSSTTFVAIDLEFWDSARGPIVIEANRAIQYDSAQINISGNTATFDASLEARADDTLVSIDSNVLAVEDTISSVGGLALLGVGDLVF